jgi:hypothetical protein
MLRWIRAVTFRMTGSLDDAERKTGGGLEKGLANLWSRKRITKKAHAGRGQETKWEMSAKLL